VDDWESETRPGSELTEARSLRDEINESNLGASQQARLERAGPVHACQGRAGQCPGEARAAWEGASLPARAFSCPRVMPVRAGCARSLSAADRAFAIGHRVRVVALYRGWQESLAREPAGVYLHDDGRSLPRRKVKGKSKREMKSLGLTLEHDPVPS
jgi:hypothetical protein